MTIYSVTTLTSTYVQFLQGAQGGPTLRPLYLSSPLSGLSRDSHIRATLDCELGRCDGGSRCGSRPITCLVYKKLNILSAPSLKAQKNFFASRSAILAGLF